MQKLKVIEEEDGKVKFELDRGRTLLVIVFGSAYAKCRAVYTDVQGERQIAPYLDVVSEAISHLDKSSYLILPKVRHYDDDDPADNDIEVYEFYQ